MKQVPHINFGFCHFAQSGCFWKPSLLLLFSLSSFVSHLYLILLPLTQGVLIIQDRSAPHPAGRRHEEIIIIVVIVPGDGFLNRGVGVTLPFIHDSVVIIIVKECIVVFRWFCYRCLLKVHRQLFSINITRKINKKS